MTGCRAVANGIPGALWVARLKRWSGPGSQHPQESRTDHRFGLPGMVHCAAERAPLRGTGWIRDIASLVDRVSGSGHPVRFCCLYLLSTGSAHRRQSEGVA
jgi:hypothetical protein